LFAKLVNGRLRTDPGYRALQAIPEPPWVGERLLI